MEDRDTKGDLYEYQLLSQIASAGQNVSVPYAHGHKLSGLMVEIDRAYA